MSAHFVDKTLNTIHASREVASPQSAITWAMGQFRLSYVPADDCALMQGMHVDRRTDGGYDIRIVATYEDNEQIYEGTVFPWGGPTPEASRETQITALMRAVTNLESQVAQGYDRIDEQVAEAVRDAGFVTEDDLDDRVEDILQAAIENNKISLSNDIQISWDGAA